MILYGREITLFNGQLTLPDRSYDSGGPNMENLELVFLVMCNWHTKFQGFWNGEGGH